MNDEDTSQLQNQQIEVFLKSQKQSQALFMNYSKNRTHSLHVPKIELLDLTPLTEIECGKEAQSSNSIMFEGD